MSSRPRALAAGLFGLAALGQDTYFKEPEKKPWLPSWELLAKHEDLNFGPTKPTIQRTQARLRLRWDFGDEGGIWSFRLQSSSRTGSDGNRFNLARFDNEASNGTNLDVAALRLHLLRPTGGAEIKGGLVENALVTTETLWDPDLRILGGTGRAFWRSSGGTVEEAGIRIQGGDVRLPAGGRVGILAAQAVVRMAFDPFIIKAFAGPWFLEARQEDAARFRRQNPTGPGGLYPEPRFVLDVLGLGVASEAIVPFEILGLRQEHRATGQRGEEFQGWLGHRGRVWWPRLGYVRQRLDPTGALASINGDLWWFHADADGQRYVATLPLPSRWEVSLNLVEQTRRGAKPPPFRRTWVELKKRF